METTESEDKPEHPRPVSEENDAVWGPAELGQFLGYETETVRTYSTQHADRLPPRIKGVKRPRWLRSVVIEWAKSNSVPVQGIVHGNVRPAPEELTAEPPKRRGGRPRKTPAH
jgi:hypothetical protein